MQARSACVSFFVLMGVIGLLSGVFARESKPGPGIRLDPDILATFQERGAVCVCIEFQETLPNVAPESSGPGVESLASRRKRYALTQTAFLATLPRDSYELRYRYRYSPAVVLVAKAPEVLAAVENNSAVRRVYPELRGTGATLESTKIIQSDLVHEAGILGAGRVTAVLDSGVDTDHEDLKDAIIHEYHFLGNGKLQGPGAEDDNGHGTHISGIIASRGNVAPPGIAPASNIIAMKVLDAGNGGWFADFAAAIEHVIDLHLNDGAIQVDAINMSLRGRRYVYPSYCDDDETVFGPLVEACKTAREVGITIFACSGQNDLGDGSTTSLSEPGCYSSTVSVGSVMTDLPDFLSRFTHRNEILDLVAPGDSITSSGINNGITTSRGCSQATPHATAVACLMREVDPTLDPDTIASVMRLTGDEVFDQFSRLFFPMVNAHRAVEAVSAPDCNENGISDFIDVHISGHSGDCNSNDVPDSCDIASGTLKDENGNGIPDECSEDNPFNRGDTNSDGAIDVSDPIFVLNYLFVGDTTARCLDAADANNDGSVNLPDAVYLLNFVFGHGPGPAAPGPPATACGFDTEDFGAPGNLGCQNYSACFAAAGQGN